MKKIIIFSAAAALLSGSGYAQQSDSVSDIFKELSTYSAEPVKQAPVESSEVVAPVVTPAPKAVEPVAQPAQEEAVSAMDEKDVSGLMDESRALFAAGEFARAQEGFRKVVEGNPENWLARMYLRTLKERDHRTVETSEMKAVNDAWSTELVFRSYILSEDARKKMELEDVEGAKDVSGSFPQINFPEGASAIYQSDLGALFVRNTRDNLQILESVMNALNLASFSTDTDQVEIEAKFVEVSEGTLEELGFQWDFDNSVEFGGDYQMQDGSGGLFSESLRGSPNNSAGGELPFSKSVEGYNQVSASGDWSTFRMMDQFSDYPASAALSYAGGDPLDLIISALDQSSGADVLSAPRIVTKSGEEATIQVGEMHSFPEVFEGDSAQGAMVNVSYEDFSDKILGVELSVTPNVDGEQITMELNPRITELVGWQEYLLAPANSIANYRQVNVRSKYQHDPVVGKLPIFKKREIECEVTIADGSTIGMGGLISEKKEAFEDKVPVLGSLPLVGRLFRNEGERAVKRNLLMFVTAKKVDPSGRINAFRTVE